MFYKINLSDNSFLITDEDYILKLHFLWITKKMSVKDYLQKPKKHFYLCDLIDGKYCKRTFRITPIEDITGYEVNCRYKLAGDIEVNDKVLGPEGIPRRVLALHQGRDEMYELTIDGKSYIVNGGHFLHLKDRDTGDTLDIPVNVFLQFPQEFQNHYVMEKVED